MPTGTIGSIGTAFTSRSTGIVLALNVLSIATALVAIPECRPALVQGRLFLESSPLIGGPAWLPLHVKVIVVDDDIFHRWDFVPLNATDVTTMRQLMTLHSVPAEIRYQRASTTIQQQQKRTDGIPRFIGAGFGLVSRNDSTSMLNGTAMASDIESRRKASTKSVIEKANTFCVSYQRDLHLIQNNCWTFGFQLYNHLRSDFDVDEYR